MAKINSNVHRPRKRNGEFKEGIQLSLGFVGITEIKTLEPQQDAHQQEHYEQILIHKFKTTDNETQKKITQRITQSTDKFLQS